MSKFSARVISWTGNQGLLQVLPADRGELFVSLNNPIQDFTSKEWGCSYRSPTVNEFVEIGWDSLSQRVWAVWPT